MRAGCIAKLSTKILLLRGGASGSVLCRALLQAGATLSGIICFARRFGGFSKRPAQGGRTDVQMKCCLGDIFNPFANTMQGHLDPPWLQKTRLASLWGSAAPALFYRRLNTLRSKAAFERRKKSEGVP